MQLVNYEDLLDVRASRGVVKDYSRPTTNQVIEPPSSYEVMFDMFRSDPVIWTAIDLTADMVTYNGYSFEGKDEEQIKKAKEKFEDEFDFDAVIKNILIQLQIYGDSYLELKFDDAELVTESGQIIKTSSNHVNSIYPLETSQIALRYDAHGEISEYVQRPSFRPLPIKDLPTWKKEEIVHFRLNWIGSRVYSYTQLDPIAKSFNTRIFFNHFLQELFKNNHPKIFYNLKNANKEQQTDFIQNLIRAKMNPAMELIGRGEATAEMIQYKFDDGLSEFWKQIRKEVLTVTRVPPHWVGDLDGANRGIGENVIIPFESRVQKIQQITASYLNRDFMPKTEFKDLTFKFNPISLASEKSILSNAEILANIGIKVADKKSHPVLAYLRNKGFSIPLDAEFEGIQKSANPCQKKDKKTDKMTSDLDRQGVSEEGMRKLEAQQMM